MAESGSYSGWSTEGRVMDWQQVLENTAAVFLAQFSASLILHAFIDWRASMVL